MMPRLQAKKPATAAHRSTETTRQKRFCVQKIYQTLLKEYPKAHCTLEFKNPLQLLVATIMAAQSTDARVNIVTRKLFKKYRTVRAFAQADPDIFQRDIASVGFFRNKTKSIIGCAKLLVDRFDGQVPQRMDELLSLPGVGRKTANVILGNVFGIPGIVVDTHVGRLSRRLGLSAQNDPDKVEQDLMELLAEDCWTMFSHLLVFHGRKVCLARKAKCDLCPVSGLCPSAFKV